MGPQTNILHGGTDHLRKAIPVLLMIGCLTIAGCSEDADATDQLQLPPDVWQVEEIEGTIGYWGFDRVEKYFINVTVPGTIDGQVTGLIEEMPVDFQSVGLRVTFSGRYFEESTNPRPMLGGQRVYSLELSSIRLSEE